jgi:putative restriction endonuclease
VTSDEVLSAFGGLTVWAKGDRRAPHKPLLVLLALGEWQRGNRDPLAFAAVEGPLAALLGEFGPPRASSPEEPFWRLRRDGVWDVGGTEHLPAPAAPDPPGLKALRAGVTGQFSAPVRDFLARYPLLVRRLARALLDAHFPPSFHDRILAAVGLDAPAAVRTRDPRFRDATLRAYGDRCAVCGVGLRFARSSVVIGVEAAHVKWFQAGGPDDVTNGLALCALHHQAFDLGAFTVAPDGRVLVSADVCGDGSEDALGRFAGGRVRPPSVASDAPAAAYLAWHREEVFRGRERS